MPFVGTDWASTGHAVCVPDQTGTTIRAFRIPTPQLGSTTSLPACAGSVRPELPVATQRPDGRLVDRLPEAGHPVVPVRSNATKAWREGEVVSGAKSDAGDAKVAAEYLRLRTTSCGRSRRSRTPPGRCGPPCAPEASSSASAWPRPTSPTATLDAFWPGAKAGFPDVEGGITLAFLARYPTRRRPQASAGSARPPS